MTGVSFVTSFSARFFIEFFNEEQVPFEQGMLLNLGQLLSLPFVGVGLILVCRRREALERFFALIDSP